MPPSLDSTSFSTPPSTLQNIIFSLFFQLKHIPHGPQLTFNLITLNPASPLLQHITHLSLCSLDLSSTTLIRSINDNDTCIITDANEGNKETRIITDTTRGDDDTILLVEMDNNTTIITITNKNDPSDTNPLFADTTILDKTGLLLSPPSPLSPPPPPPTSSPHPFFTALYNMKNITSLDLTDSRLDIETIKLITKFSSFLNLSFLNLEGNKIGENGLKIILSSKFLITKNLHSLNLSSNQLTNNSIQLLLNSSSLELSNLEELNLSKNRFSYDGINTIALSQNLSNLITLDLGWNKLNCDCFITLSNSSRLFNLKRLIIQHCGIGDKGIKAIVRSNIFANNLEHLDLYWNYISIDSIRAMTSLSPPLPVSVSVEVQNVGKDTQTSEVLLEKPSSLMIESETTSIISTSSSSSSRPFPPRLQNLHELNLECCSVSDDCVELIANSNVFVNLYHLNLKRNNIGVGGIKSIFSSLLLHNLRQSESTHSPNSSIDKEDDIFDDHDDNGDDDESIVFGKGVESTTMNALSTTATTTTATTTTLLSSPSLLPLPPTASASAALSKLSMLNLSNNHIGDEGVNIIVNNIHLLPNIIEINAEFNQIKRQTITSIQNNFPTINIKL